MTPRPPNHNVVVRDAARSALEPLGLVQRGRSRTWLDDRTWHLIVVEFQPSGWSKGSYLNVGVMWLWRVTHALTFDYGYRLAEFEPADQPAWTERVDRLAARAASRVRELRAEIVDLAAATAILDPTSTEGGWPRFNAAIANGLLGRTDRARRLMREELATPVASPWHADLQARTRELAAHLDDPQAFRTDVLHDIIRTREALNLVELSGEDIERSLLPEVTFRTLTEQ